MLQGALQLHTRVVSTAMYVLCQLRKTTRCNILSCTSEEVTSQCASCLHTKIVTNWQIFSVESWFSLHFVKKGCTKIYIWYVAVSTLTLQILSSQISCSFQVALDSVKDKYLPRSAFNRLSKPSHLIVSQVLTFESWFCPVYLLMWSANTITWVLGIVNGTGPPLKCWGDLAVFATSSLWHPVDVPCMTQGQIKGLGQVIWT